MTEQKRFMKIDDVAEYFGVTKTTIARLVKSGNFPKPIRLGKRISFWDQADIEKFIESSKTQ